MATNQEVIFSPEALKEIFSQPADRIPVSLNTELDIADVMGSFPSRNRVADGVVDRSHCTIQLLKQATRGFGALFTYLFRPDGLNQRTRGVVAALNINQREREALATWVLENKELYSLVTKTTPSTSEYSAFIEQLTQRIVELSLTSGVSTEKLTHIATFLEALRTGFLQTPPLSSVVVRGYGCVALKQVAETHLKPTQGALSVSKAAPFHTLQLILAETNKAERKKGRKFS